MVGPMLALWTLLSGYIFGDILVWKRKTPACWSNWGLPRDHWHGSLVVYVYVYRIWNYSNMVHGYLHSCPCCAAIDHNINIKLLPVPDNLANAMSFKKNSLLNHRKLLYSICSPKLLPCKALNNGCNYVCSAASLWASCQIRKIAVCACAGNAGNVFPVTAGRRSRHASRHVRDARAVMHAGIANYQFPLKSAAGETVPGIPGACATRNFTYLVRGPYTGPTTGSYAPKHLPWTKWPLFRRRYIQLHFPEWKVLYFG